MTGEINERRLMSGRLGSSVSIHVGGGVVFARAASKVACCHPFRCKLVVIVVSQSGCTWGPRRTRRSSAAAGCCCRLLQQRIACAYTPRSCPDNAIRSAQCGPLLCCFVGAAQRRPACVAPSPLCHKCRLLRGGETNSKAL